jgi:hypothetical protein
MKTVRTALQQSLGVVVLISLAVVLGLGRAVFLWLPPASVSLPLPVVRGQILEVPTLLSVGSRQTKFIGAGSCNLGYVNGEGYSGSVRAQHSGITALGGWVVDTVSQAVPTHVWIVLHGSNQADSYQVQIHAFDARPDVQQALGGSPAYVWSGFVVQFGNRTLTPGNYHVYIIFQRGQQFVTCDNGRQLVIYG